MGVDSTSIRVFWPSTHASIPAGWSRDTAFDEKFLQGDDSGYTGPSDAGGSHNHTANTHTHTGDTHRHTFTGASKSTTTLYLKDGGTRLDITLPYPDSHTHSLGYGAYATITYQNTVVTINTTDAMPPYMKVIVIKPDSAVKDIPDDAVCYTDETVLPTGFVKYAALDDKFIRGADTGSGDGGGTGGAATHIHVSPVHDHVIDSHSHTIALCGNAVPSRTSLIGSPNAATRTRRHHNVAMSSTALSDLTDTAVTVAAASSEPAYIKLLGIQNTSGDATTPIGVIAGFIGAVGTIPSNWQLCNGTGDTIDCRDKQIWSTPTDGQIGVTGGSNTHTHTITGTHGHTHGSHNHNSGTVTLTGEVTRQTGSPSDLALTTATHTHTWSIANSTPTLQAASVTLSGTEDGRSAYRTLVWVKKMEESPPAGTPLMMSLF